MHVSLLERACQASWASCRHMRIAAADMPALLFFFAPSLSHLSHKMNPALSHHLLCNPAPTATSTGWRACFAQHFLPAPWPTPLVPAHDHPPAAAPLLSHSYMRWVDGVFAQRLDALVSYLEAVRPGATIDMQVGHHAHVELVSRTRV